MPDERKPRREDAKDRPCEADARDPQEPVDIDPVAVKVPEGDENNLRRRSEWFQRRRTVKES